MGLLSSNEPDVTKHLTLRRAIILAIALAVTRGSMVGWAAWADDAWSLPGEGTGLLRHPGAFAVLFGDSLLVVIIFQARRMTGRLGRRLPTIKPLVVRRYFRHVIYRTAFKKSGDFFQMFALLSAFGAVFLINQSHVLINPSPYYGHDTFDSFSHIRTFLAARFCLIISWCMIVPYFGSLLFAHCLCVSRLFKKIRKRGWVAFVEGHPDRCGGYAFFGWVDVVYASGIAVILSEAALLIMTHGRLTFGSAWALFAIGFGAAMISIFSIVEVLRTLRRKERLLKTKGFWLTRRAGRITLDYAALIYATSFSPYTKTAARLAIGLRTLMGVPAVYRFIQLIFATT